MAKRPIFIVSLNKTFFKKEIIEFKYFNGFSISQKQKSIESLHHEYLKKNKKHRILEISSKSNNEIGVKLSAFNLIISTYKGKKISVESAFQASKVFKNGGPYLDLLCEPSKKSKKDQRLKNSGELVEFNFFGKTFEAEPKTFFYNWLYINTINLHKELANQLIEFDAFTDIEFNPIKSINCQAEAAAIYVSLRKQNLLSAALKNKDNFNRIVYQIDFPKTKQMTFFDD